MSDLPPGFSIVKPGEPETQQPALLDLPPGFRIVAQGGPPDPVSPFAVAEDVAKSVPSRFARGTAGLGGAVADIANMPDQLWQYGTSKIAEKMGWLTPEQATAIRQPLGGGLEGGKTRPLFPDMMFESAQGRVPTSEGLREATGKATGMSLYEPKTVPGEYAGTVSEFLPGMALGSGTFLQRLAQVAVPALLSETGGQAARKFAPDSPMVEGGMRVGGALLGAGGVGAFQYRRTPEQVIARAMSGGAVDANAIKQAEGLMQTAASQGVNLTWQEAIDQVTNSGSRLGDVMRVVENSRGGGNVMKPFFAERPAQVQAAGNTAFDVIAPNKMDPVRAGIAAQKAAEGTIADTTAAINKQTRPLYSAAERQRVGPAVQQMLERDPIYAGTLKEVRGNPELNKTIAGLPDDSVGVIDIVQRRIGESATNRATPGQASTSNLAAVNLGDTRTSAVAAADNVTGGQTGTYATARAEQARLRQRDLEPLTEGTIGKIAATTDLGRQGRALLPDRPLPGSERAVSDTVTQLAAKSPDAAANVIHSRLRAVFDETATQENQWGGSKFYKAITDNTQQAKDLEAGITALVPNGDLKWTGFRRFLDVMEATGKRPQQGSATAYNQAIQQELGGGGIVADVVTAIPTGGLTIPKRLNDFRKQMALGANTEQIARILTNPAAGRLLERLATEPQGSNRAALLAFRLSYMGRTAGTGGSQSSPQPTK